MEYKKTISYISEFIRDSVRDRYENDKMSFKDINNIYIDLINDINSKEYFIINEVKEEIKEMIDEIVMEYNLCPKCFTKLSPVFEREFFGHRGSEPIYAEIGVALTCECCDYTELV